VHIFRRGKNKISIGWVLALGVFDLSLTTLENTLAHYYFVYHFVLHVDVEHITK